MPRKQNDAVIAELGRRRARLISRLEETETELWAAIVAADKADVSKAHIARAAGVSRQTVYNVLAASEQTGGSP